MDNTKATFMNAWPYQQDKMNLPVKQLGIAITFYEQVMGFKALARSHEPHESVVLERDGVQIGLSENGGDSSQDGCFFEVDDVEVALSEFRTNGGKEISDLKTQMHGETKWRVFFVIAPDGLCYCIGQRQK